MAKAAGFTVASPGAIDGEKDNNLIATKPGGNAPPTKADQGIVEVPDDTLSGIEEVVEDKASA